MKAKLGKTRWRAQESFQLTERQTVARDSDSRHPERSVESG